MISRELLFHTADLARLDLALLSEAEVQRLAEQLGKIIEYVDLLKEVDTTGVEATVHPVVIPTRLRADVPAATPGAEPLLRNAPARSVDSFLVPRVVGHGGEDE